MSKPKNPELPHMINLVMGDWSGDGHSQTATVTIISNIDKKALEKAHKAGAKKTDVNFEDDVAADYEDNTISKDDVDKLSKFGFKIEDYSEDEDPGDDDDDPRYCLWTDGYALAWLFVAQIGNPDFKFEVIEDDSPNINIGGYGLLGN